MTTAVTFCPPATHLAASAQNRAEASPLVDLRPLGASPWVAVEGVFWAGFVGFGVSFLATSLNDLRAALTHARSAAGNLDRIGSAALKAFTDLLSLSSSIAYLARWADEAKIIVLGRCLPFVKNLCLGTSLAVNLLETGGDLYSIWAEKEALRMAGSPQEKEMHRQLLCHALIKLAGNVSMIAWGVLGIASLAGGLVVSPAWLTMTLGAGCLFGTAAFFYKTHLDQQHKRLVRV